MSRSQNKLKAKVRAQKDAKLIQEIKEEINGDYINEKNQKKGGAK